MTVAGDVRILVKRWELYVGAIPRWHQQLFLGPPGSRSPLPPLVCTCRAGRSSLVNLCHFNEAMSIQQIVQGFGNLDVWLYTPRTASTFCLLHIFFSHRGDPLRMLFPPVNLPKAGKTQVYRFEFWFFSLQWLSLQFQTTIVPKPELVCKELVLWTLPFFLQGVS